MDRPITIIRAQRSAEQPYFLHRRATAQDRSLSFEARGMLGYILSKPDDWLIEIPDLMNEGNIGRDQVRRILNELLKAGYIKRVKERDDKGRFTDWLYLVFEHPQTENPALDKPALGNPTPENPQQHNKRDSTESESPASALGEAEIDTRPVRKERESRRAAKNPETAKSKSKAPDNEIKSPKWEAFCDTFAYVCGLDMEVNAGEIRSWAKILWNGGKGYSRAALFDFNWWWWKHDWRGAIKQTYPAPKQVVELFHQALNHEDSMLREMMREDGHLHIDDEDMIEQYRKGRRFPAKNPYNWAEF